MKRKPQAKGEPEISPEIISAEIRENAKRSLVTDRVRPALKCIVCSGESSGGGAEPLCWVCRRLKISAWRDVEQQIPAQE